MSLKQIDPDLGLQRLLDEGYDVVLDHQHLKIKGIPFVGSNREISYGILICPYITNANSILPPDNHQVWWTEEFPCFANGSPIEQFRNEDGSKEIFPGCVIKHRFSNKPDGSSNFADYYTKLTHYLFLIQAQAQVINPSVNARQSGNTLLKTEERISSFSYQDTASARAEIQSLTSRLELKRIAIIGVGGTGSYILDQVAKTPVNEIHLFDGDEFLQHNAFRAPGAASIKEIANKLNKADYFKSKYTEIHKGIISHPYHLDICNINELMNFDFVFLSVDRGSIRKLVYEHLSELSTPFIDVGMNLYVDPSSGKLSGSCRYTLYNPNKISIFKEYAPMDDDEGNELYRQNIQVADMNALNAQLAVMKWKQYFGFYQDDFESLNGLFTVNFMSLARAGNS